MLIITRIPDVTGEALEAGANEVLIKPIDPGMLVAAAKMHTRNSDGDIGEVRTKERPGNWQRRELSQMTTRNLTGKNNKLPPLPL